MPTQKKQTDPAAQTPENDPSRGGRKMTSKRIVALLGVVLLAAMYLVTLIVAIADKNSSGKWFMLCLIATVTVPLLIWIYTWMYGVLTQRHTIASFELPSKNPSGEASDPADFPDGE